MCRLFFFCLWGLMISTRLSATCTLPSPQNLQAKNITSCSMEVSWKKVNGASYYQVRYKLSSIAVWTYSATVTTTKLTLSGLQPSSSYDLAVASYCADATTSGYSNAITRSTLACTKPTGLTVAVLSAFEAKASWTPICGTTLFSVQYRKQGVSTWTTVNGVNGTEYLIGSLSPQTNYECRIRSDCGGVYSGYTSIVSFTTPMAPPDARKNILFIFLDDGRYDSYQPTGAPSWVETPAINRIATEGVNFQIAIPTTSQCAPSRATVYTGLYSFHHGVLRNGDTLNKALTLVQTLLQQRGYYTGFIGKFGQRFGDPRGFHWWAVSRGNNFINETYSINGVSESRPGHISDVYFNLAKEFIATVPAQTPFALFYFTRVPHHPTTPRPEDESLYLNESMPFPSNFNFYTSLYPSYYHARKWNADSATVRAEKLEMFQCLRGVEANVDSFFYLLEQRGALDSTLIIFSSDNGYLMGEHQMQAKVVALEESIRVPLFVRYPAWFAAGTVVTHQIASNIDIPVTLLEFAGIPNIYGFQGISLRALASGAANRSALLYDFGGDNEIPPIRAVRTLTDKFIRSYCTSTTEEYFDLVADPQENVNLIFNSAYQQIIQQRRLLLDSLRQLFADITPVARTCSLVGSSRLGSGRVEELVLYPQPADNHLTVVTGMEGPVSVEIHDLSGHLLQVLEKKDGERFELNISMLAEGSYLLSCAGAKGRKQVLLMVQRP
ncbi:MAG: sulfatase-like hydrolase/transferase [Chitinophagales bacterium]|nr:sulfatase-like hydrolase/transferase [Chitinophagales bacterium]MDW8394419.1 sulfatase-like hydrolase/transferase [Chitinophagales bacterium]